MGNKVIIEINCRDEEEAETLKNLCDQQIKPVLSLIVSSGQDIIIRRE